MYMPRRITSASFKSIRRFYISRFLSSSRSTNMANPTRSQELWINYQKVEASVKAEASSLNAPADARNPDPRLVAVSKFKPASDIQALYDNGVRHFGENYVQELVEKAKDLPQDIDWHFIGALQTNKCKVLAKIPNLWAVETVDNATKAQKLNDNRPSGNKLNIFLQINTSHEPTKSGIADVETALQVAQSVLLSCPNLTLKGLMTIGSFEESTSIEENHDFKRLMEFKQVLDEKLALSLELSMGMSNDFQQAIRQGSTNVRVGSLIFGSRPPKST